MGERKEAGEGEVKARGAVGSFSEQNCKFKVRYPFKNSGHHTTDTLNTARCSQIEPIIRAPTL